LSKVVLDEGVPEPLAHYLSGHEVRSVRELGFKGLKNGKLLDAIEAAVFDAFITNDKRMDAEQQLWRRPFGILILSTNSWPVLRRHTEKIAAALASAAPGTVSIVDCGRFVPQKRRKAVPPSP
jgi:hypothetical protein